jgi:hypothetical protein
MTERLKSGDLLLFDGQGSYSNVIKFFLFSPLSHAAVVYECPKTGALYAWETGSYKKRDGRNKFLLKLTF